MDKLLAYLPDNALSCIQKWSNGFKVKITITRDRSSKLGDYHKDPQGTHQITINHNLEPELFFFVLTHELAHLLAFEHFGRKIPPHGVHWKTVYTKHAFREHPYLFLRFTTLYTHLCKES